MTKTNIVLGKEYKVVSVGFAMVGFSVGDVVTVASTSLTSGRYQVEKYFAGEITNIGFCYDYELEEITEVKGNGTVTDLLKCVEALKDLTEALNNMGEKISGPDKETYSAISFIEAIEIIKDGEGVVYTDCNGEDAVDSYTDLTRIDSSSDLDDLINYTDWYKKN